MNEEKKPRCPNCEEKVDHDDILIPIYDKTSKKLIHCYHVNIDIWKGFIEKMEKTGMTFEDFIKRVMSQL